MSEKRKFNIVAPVIAVGIITIGVVLAFRYLFPEIPDFDPGAESTDLPTPSDQAETPVEDPDIIAFVQPIGSIETPVSSSWSTYHGAPNLSGLTETVLPDTPEVLWRFQTEGSLYYTPVADEHGIYVNTLKGGVYALDFEGNLRWSKRLVHAIRDDGSERLERLEAPIACFLSTVFVGSLNGKVYAFDSETGDERWVYKLDAPVLGTVTLHTPKEGEGPPRLLVISQDDGSLHSIDPKTGERIWKTEAIDRCDSSASINAGHVVYGSCAAALHVFSAEDGTHVRDIDLDADSQVASGVAIAGDSIFSGSHSGRFFHASLANGGLVWVNEDSYDEIFSTPALSEKLVIFGSLDGIVYALDRATGERRWTFESEGLPTSAVIAAEKVVLGVDGVLFFLRLETGEAIWSYEISDEIASPAIIRDMVVIGSEDGTVTAFGRQKT